MENMYGFYTAGSTGGQYYYAEDKPLMSPVPENMVLPPSEFQTLFYSTGAVSGSHSNHHYHHQQRMLPSYDVYGSEMELPTVISESASIAPEQGEDTERAVKARIKSHPSYPRLLEAYIDCQKVGAPPEISILLEEIRSENEAWKCSDCCFGADPELDEFMETYIDLLVKYKSDLEKPFDEATTFLHKIELQLSNLSTTDSFSPDECGGLSDEEFSGVETEVAEAQVTSENRSLKDRLLRDFGSHINSLKLEFSKKKKKGKLPREARQTLLEWWSLHYKWPYPTEVDKTTLAQSTGLDQKQINNWFINQRKRHWKPSENMQLALMDNPGQFFTDD